MPVVEWDQYSVQPNRRTGSYDYCPLFAEPRLDVEEGDDRHKGDVSPPCESSREIKDDPPPQEERDPYDCISNPAPWHHQITVSP